MMHRISSLNWLHSGLHRGLHGVALSALLMVATCVSAGERAGAVQLVLGDASVLGADGKARALLRGDFIEAGQVLTTGASGHIHLQMVDGAFVSVRPKSRLRIEEYRYDQTTPSNNRIKFVLEEGVTRSITGKAGEAARENFRMNTPLAAIGIRGTDFVVQADKDLTRVTVQAGAIDMTPFSGDCLASSLGGCKSATTRTLTAAMRNAYLELRSRNEVPKLVPAEKAFESPNIIAPPVKEEPRVSLEKTSKVVTPTDNRDTLRDVTADSLKGKVAAATPAPPAAPELPPLLTTPPTVEVVTPPVVVVTTPVIPVTPAPETVFWWGRWAPFIQTGEASMSYSARASGTGRELVGGNSVFGMTRQAGVVDLPSSGVAKFTFGDAEAYFMRDNKTLTAATVTSPSLTIDFGNRRFETALTMSAAGQTTYVLSTVGEITFQGVLYNDLGAATQLTGSLSKDTKQAGYVFQRDISGNTSVVGATRWYR